MGNKTHPKSILSMYYWAALCWAQCQAVKIHQMCPFPQEAYTPVEEKKKITQRLMEWERDKKWGAEIEHEGLEWVKTGYSLILGCKKPAFPNMRGRNSPSRGTSMSEGHEGGVWWVWGTNGQWETGHAGHGQVLWSCPVCKAKPQKGLTQRSNMVLYKLHKCMTFSKI